jgi:hypothetical protein
LNHTASGFVLMGVDDASQPQSFAHLLEAARRG